MIRGFIKYPVQFILLVLIQVLVLNNIQLSGFINPFLYILFILWLPIETNKVLVMFLAFLIGFSVDIFGDTVGMHASACVFLAFVRPSILQFLAPRDGYDLIQTPSISEFGLVWFLTYAAIGTVLHHIFLFTVEIFRFSEFFSTLGRALLSSIFTLILILITQFFHYNSEEKR